jgi:hypothetical protein
MDLRLPADDDGFLISSSRTRLSHETVTLLAIRRELQAIRRLLEKQEDLPAPEMSGQAADQEAAAAVPVIATPAGASAGAGRLPEISPPATGSIAVPGSNGTGGRAANTELIDSGTAEVDLSVNLSSGDKTTGQESSAPVITTPAGAGRLPEMLPPATDSIAVPPSVERIRHRPGANSGTRRTDSRVRTDARIDARIRSSNGRFASSKSENTDDNENSNSIDLIAGNIGNLASAISIQNADQADPLVAAWGEISEPFKGVSELFGGGDKDRKQEAWWRRMLKELKLFRKEEREANAKSGKTLRAIQDKPVAIVNESSSLGRVMLLLASLIPGLSKIIPSLSRIIPSLSRIIPGLSRIIPGLSRIIPGLSAAAGRVVAFMKRIPWLGVMIESGMATFDILQTEKNTELSRREKDIRNGASIGAAGGAVSGMMAGAAAGMALGPIGALIGGVVGGLLGKEGGAIIGEVAGGWANDFRATDVAGEIKTQWAAVSDEIRGGWKKISDRWDKMFRTGDEAWDAASRAAERLWKDTASYWSSLFGVGTDSEAASSEQAKPSGIFESMIQSVGALFVATSDHRATSINADSILIKPATAIAAPEVSFASAAVAAVAARPPISTPPANKPTEAPTVSANSAGFRQPEVVAKVIVPVADADRNLPDRRIAHIQSGGLSD